MKRIVKKLYALLLTLAMVFAISITTFAADSTVTYKGQVDGIEFLSGSGYTDTDLFDSFKDVMPGDRLTETIQIQNKATDSDYIKVYLRAAVKDQEGNPLTYNEAFENTDGKDQAGVEGQRDETIATMAEFLAQLTMRIYNGTQLIYEASPDQAGALEDNVLLATLFNGESSILTVELDVPIDMGNEYANRVGEVDWIFLVEAFDYEKLTVHKVWDDNNYPNRPDSATVQLLRDGSVHDEVVLNETNQWTYTWDKLDETYTWSVIETDVPDEYDVTYSTADNITWITNHMDYTPPQDPDPIDLTVRKVWSGDENHLQTRPGSVNVTLYDGNTAIYIATLSADNNWTFTWNNLDGNGNWSVVETGIPKGYVPSYQASGDTVTITNTATLIQTGQFNWPILVLGCLGALMITFGVVMLVKKRKSGYV